MFGVLLSTLLPLTTALQWTDSLTNNTLMSFCSASEIHLPWNFTLSPDERIEDIKWIYRAEPDGSDILIAVYVAGQFGPMPAFSGRVQWTGQGGIVVSQAQSGLYTVVVHTGDAAHPLVTFSKTVSLQVAEPPTAESGKLHVLQMSDAVVDNTTGQWRVQLTCGVFTALGLPAVHVVWTTPDGHTVESSSEHNGTFRLLLPNPPSGGNYTCTLPPLSPATRCLPPLSPLLEGATVTVDEGKVSFTLLEARQRETEARQRETEARQNETEAKQQEMQRKLGAENEQLRKDVGELQSRLNATSATATATLRVSFSAQLSAAFTSIGTIQPFYIVTNEGNAFNGTTGFFTAPRNGTYFFVASAQTQSSDSMVYMFLMKNDVGVSGAITRQYGDYHAMGSVQATLHLTAGQRVSLKNVDRNGEYAINTTSFTGFLVRADD
ncbi:uncharacterized protein [Littorina saxatilis]